MSDPKTIALSAPIPGMDLQPVSSVTLTPPTGRHLMRAGSIMRMVPSGDGGDPAIEISPAGMGKLIGLCCTLPTSSVEALSAADFMAISNELMGFLAPSAS